VTADLYLILPTFLQESFLLFEISGTADYFFQIVGILSSNNLLAN